MIILYGLKYNNVMKTILKEVADIIFPSEKSVFDFMREKEITKLRLYITNYVDHSNYSTFGYSVKNVNSDYYKKQGTISRKTKDFVLEQC